MDAEESGVVNLETEFIPRISIVAFSYNFGKYISECLESLVNQNLKPYEIIVCDDCSTDDSWSHIQRYKKKYPDLFRIFRHDENIGHVQNGIFGKEQARGNLLTVIDGDDRWHPDKLKLEWLALKNNPRARTAYSGVTLINEAGEKIGSWMDPSGAPPPSGDVFVQTFAKRFFPNTPSLFRNQLIYTDVLKEINYKEFNQELIHADWNLKLNLAARYEVAYSGKPLVDYRQHGTSIHRMQTDKLYESAKYVISKNLPLLRERSGHEIEFVLAGINALMVRLATMVNRPVISYSKEQLFPPQILVNSVPRSGANTLANLLSTMPGLQNAGLHLGNSTFNAASGAVGVTVPLGIDMPKQVPLGSLTAPLANIESGAFVSSHIPYSEELNGYLQENDLKMVVLVRDPRDVVVSHAKYVNANKRHPLHQYYLGLSPEEQISTSIRGVKLEGIELLSIAERFESVAKWIDNPHVLLVKIEDLVATGSDEMRGRQQAAVKGLSQFLNVMLGDIYVKEIIDSFMNDESVSVAGSIGSWETELIEEQLDEIYKALGNSTAKLGYTFSASQENVEAAGLAKKEAPYEGGNLVFLISQPRSGSTLLQRILGAHEEISTLAEPWIMLHPLYALRKRGIQTEYNAQLTHDGLEDFINSLPGGKNDYLDGIRAMAAVWYGRALAGTEKRLFLDKTPRYYNIIPELAEIFPRSKIVLLVRNPLSVISSILKTWVGKNWNRLQLHREDMLRAPSLMANAMDSLGDRLTVMRYEDFIQNPEQEVERLCTEIGVPYRAEMLNYGLKPAPAGRMGDSVGIKKYSKPEKASLEKWKLTFSDPLYRLLAEVVLTLVGPSVLEKLGYNHAGLFSSLNEIPLDQSVVQQQELVAMISALGLTKESLQSIEHLFAPYLQNTLQTVY